MDEVAEVFEYDVRGRLKYHPELHPNHKKPWSEEDIEYLCKYAEVDTLDNISLALGRTCQIVVYKLRTLRRDGKYDYYKTLNKHW